MTTETQTDAAFEEFLAYLSVSRNFDFTAYKRGSLTRRVQKRMQAVKIETYSDYTDYLTVHPEEFSELFNTILINVTSFFRDAPAWEYLAREVIPSILAAKRPDEAIRVWSAGCASGEEAFTIAMVLAEAMGEADFRRRVKIYATDIDDDALNTARQATYSARDLAAVPEEYREKYFEASDGRFAFRKDLRRIVIFGRHDLLQDAPISRVDLLVCRNTLMYMNTEGQTRVIARFFFAVNNSGYLLLGKAESLLTHSSMIVPIDLKLRVFAKVARPNLRDRLTELAQGEPEEAMRVAVSLVRLRDVAFDLDPVPTITIDLNGLVVGINERARAVFGVNVTDVGRPLRDLELSYRPVELRSLIDQAHEDGNHSAVLRNVEWTSGETTRWFDINVLALPDGNGGMLGSKIVFNDVTGFRQLQRELEQSKNELETAYEELQSTNEELETTNEELQSTVEELETTNEELQSTNEELETMNEELQSTNEELETVNNETGERSKELNSVNAFLENILTSMSAAVVVVDRDFAVQVWNAHAEDMWGLRAGEVRGKHFLNLDIGLPLEKIAQPMRDCLGQADGYRDVLSLSATNRRGRAFTCEVSVLPLQESGGTGGGVILLMEEEGAAVGERPAT